MGLIVKTEKVWQGRQRGIEERRKISWKREGGKIFVVINGRKTTRLSSKGEVKERVWNFPLKIPTDTL